jgi:hypothetical protein
MRNLIIAFVIASTGACADSPDTTGKYSCLIRFQCVGSDDILARQAFPCADNYAAAMERTEELSYQVADERCGVGSWSWTWTDCDEAPVLETSCPMDNQ